MDARAHTDRKAWAHVESQPDSEVAMDLISAYTEYEALPERKGDAASVRAWRAQQLGRLGLPSIVAEVFADEVDWHSLASLVERGCSPALALEIIR